MAKINIRSKLIDVTDGMKDAVAKEFVFLDRYLEEPSLDVRVSKKKEGLKLVVQLSAPHMDYVRSDVYCEDFYLGIKELKRQFKEDFLREYKHAKDHNKRWRDLKNEAEKEYNQEFIDYKEENEE